MLSGSALTSLNSLSALTSLRKYVVVSFLNSATITLPAESKTRVCEIEAQVVSYLQRLGMRDTDFFGLAIRNDDEYIFVECENKLSKYASRHWKVSSNDLESLGNALLKFEYRVKYYLSSSYVIRDRVSRLHYYLQLRENVLNYGQDLEEEVVLKLASLALQADIGDYNPERHSGAYFEPSQYFPVWILDQMGPSYFLERMPSLHSKFKGMSAADAHAQFIREASITESPHNVHLYKLRRKKHDPSTQVAVSICDKGISIYEEEKIQNKTSKKLIQSFLWSNIEDLSFDKKKFEIRAPCYPGKMTFFTSSDEKSKHLLQLCRLTHQFSRNQRWRASEPYRSSSHDRRSRGYLMHGEGSYEENRSSFSSLGGYIGMEGGVQRISMCSNASSNTTSGVVSDRLLSLDGSQDLDRENGTSSSAGQSIESGVASIMRSLSIASSSRTDSSDQDNEHLSCGIQYTPSSSPDLNAPSWDNQSRREGSGFGRTSSIHSSSSQHSASTVRSRYSLVPSRHRHELALGAQLADLSLAPDLPDLADLPAMAADMVARGDEVPDSVHHIHSTSHNCCSTCCDDNASLASDDVECERERDNQRGICICGSCNICVLGSSTNNIVDEEERLYATYGGSENPEHQLFAPNPVFADDDSVAAQPDLDDTIASTYNFSEEDFSQLDNNDDYVEFYKGEIHYQEAIPQVISNQQNLARDEIDGINLSNTSGGERDAQNVDNNIGNQGLRSQRSSPVEEEQTLDYSVESAQASLASGYPTNKNMLSWALLMGSQNNELQHQYLQPSPVSMSKVTTITPVNIASSRCNIPSTSPEVKQNNYKKSGLLSSDALVSEVSAANASEAPAKFITSKPRITVLKAHTQLASTTAPSFSSVPLTRAKIHTLPQVQCRPKPDSIQSLQRVALPDPKPLGLISPYAKEEIPPCAAKFNNHPLSQVPVIRANNYLDVHASSNLNRERLRAHPEQLPSKTPRSLYLKNQKKKLQQQTIQDKYQIEQLHQQLLSDTVYQPSAYAQGVGVPLLPSPKYTGCPASKSQKQYHPRFYEASQSVHPTQASKISQNIPQPYHLAQQQCYQMQNQPEGQQEMGISHQNILYQPHIRNFFQNPPPPAPHPGYGIGVCPGNQSSLSPEILSPTYQCLSDPGLYPMKNPSNHPQPQQSLATVYTNQVTQSQIEQFKAQLNSDADYVIYPHKDPAISRQEYMDAKQSQVIASRVQRHLEQQLQGTNNAGGTLNFGQLPPPYRSPKSSQLYRSTPNVAGSLVAGTMLSSYPSYQSLASQGSTHQPGSSSGYSSMARGRYFSQQSLASSFSSAPSTYSASTQSLTGSLDPYADPLPMPHSPSTVMRVRSDESILSSSGALTEMESPSGSLHPPNIPPPPYRPKEILDNSGNGARDSPTPRVHTRSRSRPRVTLQQVRECGSQLDVPLLAALCSDSSLLAQESRPRTSSSKTSKQSKHQKSSVNDCTNPSSSTEVSPPIQESSMNVEEQVTPGAAALSAATPQCKYSLSGVYTTNQVPAPQVTAKLSSKTSKSANGIHQHPKPQGRQQSKSSPLSQSHQAPSAKLKHKKSMKEIIEYNQN